MTKNTDYYYALLAACVRLYISCTHIEMTDLESYCCVQNFASVCTNLE